MADREPPEDRMPPVFLTEEFISFPILFLDFSGCFAVTKVHAGAGVPFK